MYIPFQNFRDQRIDGACLSLLSESHLTESLKMKLGPALKLRSFLAYRTQQHSHSFQYPPNSLQNATSCMNCSNNNNIFSVHKKQQYPVEVQGSDHTAGSCVRLPVANSPPHYNSKQYSPPTSQMENGSPHPSTDTRPSVTSEHSSASSS